MIPDIWLKNAIAMASMITLRCPGVKNGTDGAFSAAASDSRISPIWKSDSSRVAHSRLLVASAASHWSAAASQRGVSGTVGSSSRKITAGTTMTPSIQRHAWSPSASARTIALDA